MVTYKFFLDGIEINPPLNWQGLQVLASFDSSSVQANISTEEFEFVNESAKQIRDYIEGGKDGTTNGIFEGLPFQIQVTDGATDLDVFDGYLDFNSYQEVSPVKVKCKIKRTNGLNSLEDRVVANSFGYLYEKDFITDADFEEIKYVVEKLNIEGDVAIVTLTLLLITLQLKDRVAQLLESYREYVLAQANPGTAPIALTNLAIQVATDGAYVALLLTEGIIILNKLRLLVVPPVKKHKVIRLRKAMEKASSYLGYTYDSNLSELDDIVYLPSKPFGDKPIEKGIPNATDFGYQLSEMFELVNRLTNSKLNINDTTLVQRSLNDPFWVQSASFQVPDVLDEKIVYNNADMSARTFVSFATDDTDAWTIDNFKGTNYEVVVSAVDGNQSPNNLLKGLEEVSIPLALGTPKTGLNAVENALNNVYTTIENLINLILVPIRLIEAIPGVGSTGITAPNLSGIISDRIGVLKVSQKTHSVAKLLYSPNGDQKINERPLQRVLSAKNLYNKYHNYNSFVANDFGGQRRIFIEKEIPFGFSNFIECIDNSYFVTEDGRVGKMEEIKWNLDGDKAVCTYWIEEVYTTNLEETFIEG